MKLKMKQYEADLNKEIDYDNEYHQDKFGNWMNPEMYRLKGLVAKKNIFGYKFDKDSKVLEYGCGIGQITSWIKDKHAFDLNKKLYPFLKSKGFFCYDKFEDIPNDFDEIVLSMCLEHIENPVELIKKLSKKLKAGGKIRLNLPGASYDYMNNMNKSNDGHYFAWGFPDINYLLNRCGFEVIYNKKIHRKGIDRFAFIYRKFGFKAYYSIITLAGYLLDHNNIDIVIIGKKIK